MAKEGLFNILANRIDFEELTVLDLFAGTGNISFEFASRGCARIISVDSNHRCLRFINDTAEQLEISSIKTIKSNVFHFLKNATQQYNLIFADPPYDLKGIERLPDLVISNGHLNNDGLLILEHPSQYNFSDHDHFSELRKYGMVHFSFFNS